MKVSKKDIVKGLRALGLEAGDKVMVHSALSALGEVEGGADAVIDALIEAIGEQGTVLMPAMPGGGKVFDVKRSPSTVGKVTDVFWRRKGVLRSRHPSHSAAAIGKDAAWMLADHHKARTAYNDGTPYRRVLEFGKILLIGCDQDRNTSLHCLEAMANAPYLKTIKRKFIDEDGKVKELTIEQMAGPHRDFIGLDRLFREAGVMTVGKIGSAVCRLMDGPGVLRVGLDALRKDPAAVLCDNPYCLDCRRQRGLIKAERLAGEDFKLSAVSDDASQDLDDALEFISHEGASAVELRQVGGVDAFTLSAKELDAIKEQVAAKGFVVSAISALSPEPDLEAMIKAAKRLDAPAVVVRCQPLPAAVVGLAKRKRVKILLENCGETAKDVLDCLAGMDTSVVQVAFNPANFAAAGEKPFLSSFRTGVKRHVGQLYIADGLWDGAPRLGAQGNGEVKELISIMRCASFNGYMTLKPGLGSGRDAFRDAGDAFWRMMDSL